MAITHRLISNPSADVAIGEHLRTRSSGVRGRRNARFMGLSATDPVGDNHLPRHANETDWHRPFELEFLTDLLVRQLGSRARNTATALLNRYNTLGSLLVAARTQITEPDTVPPQVWEQLRTLSQLLSSAWRAEAFKSRVISTSEALITYLQLDMCGLERECFRILFLGPDNHLLDDRILWEGTINRVHVYPREVVRQAIELSATALILIHNHPYGSPAPSATDRQLTKQIVDACAVIEVAVHDHVIVGREGIFSFAANSFVSNDRNGPAENGNQQVRS